MNTGIEIPTVEKEVERGLLQDLAILWAQRVWIILGAIIFAGLALVYGKLQPPQYQATALVQFESRQGGIQLSQNLNEILNPVESNTTTEIEIIKSRLVLSDVVETQRLDIYARPHRLKYIGDFLSRYSLPKPGFDFLDGYAWHGESIDVSSLIIPDNWLGSNVVITKSAGNNYTALTPDGMTLEGVVGETLLDSSSGFSLTIQTLEAEIGTRFFVGKVNALSTINSIRSGLSIFERGRSTGILQISMVSRDPNRSEIIVEGVVNAYIKQNISRSAEEVERSLNFLTQQLPQVQEQLRAAEAVLNNYRLENESIDLDFEAASILDRIVALDAQLSGMSLEESELSRQYTTNHPTYVAFLEKRNFLIQEKKSLSDYIKELPSTQQEVLRMTRDVEVNQAIYVQLLNKSQELKVLKAGTVGNVRLIDSAIAGRSPIAPNIQRIVPYRCPARFRYRLSACHAEAKYDA